VRGAVRIVFDALNLGGNAILVATEVDNAVVVLVTTALVTGGDVAVVVAAGVLDLLFQQRCVRSALVQVRIDNLDDRAATRRRRFNFH